MKLLGLIFVIFLSVEFIGFNLDLEDISTKSDRNILPEKFPKSQTYQFDENNYSFNSTEIISRNFGWSNLTTSNIEYEVPSQYNFTQANITITVTNSTIKEEIIDGDDETGSRSIDEKAQSFEISEDSYLVNLSLYFGDGGKNEFSPNLEIRNNTHNGSVIHSFSHIFSQDLSKEWVNITFDPYLYLKSGTYYLWMDNGYTFSKAWWTGQDNDTDTWYVTGGDWTPANFDLTLKVYTSNIVTPEDVNLRVEDIPVLNDGDKGNGHTNFSGTINNSTMSLNVTVDSGISYKYSVNSTCYRNYSSIANFTINDEIVNWNLSLDLIDPGSEYTGYSAQISGFRSDYDYIRAYNGISPVDVDRIDDQNILILEVADTITFRGQNYVSSINIDAQVFIGDLISINGTVLDEGNVTVVIEAINETLIYQNSSIFTDTYSFLWYIDPSIPYGNYSATAFYIGEGEVGNKRINFTVLNKASMSCGDVTGYSFDNLSISCNYIDAFTNLHIEDASMNYSISGIIGDMIYEIEDENYIGILDLTENPILPGSYLGICSVTKEGYNPIVTNFNLNILPRNISVIITNNISTVFHGENLGINISIVDNRDMGIVKIPINLELKIIKDSEEDSEDIVLVENLTGISQSANFSWTIPSNLDVGQYKIMVTSISDYYEGSNTLNDAFTLYNKAYMKCTDVTALVFENVTLEGRYYDAKTNQPIENASMNYKILNIEGLMEFDDQLNGNYTGNIDLNFYRLRPGIYTITYFAQKEGFNSIETSTNIILEWREVEITLSKSTSTVSPGQTVTFEITLKDKKTGGILLYPIDLEFKIIQNTNNTVESIVVSEDYFSLTQYADYKWIIPNNIGEGEYNIRIEVNSEFYLGKEIFLKSINIIEPISWWIYLLIALGSLTAMGGTFIFTQRLRTRHSVKGIILLHNSGIPIAQEMIHGTLKYNPILFSGAISGVIALIKEITGQKLHTMEIEGGFLNIIKGEDSLLVVVLQKNPLWIKGILQKCFDEILNDHGSEIEEFKGATIDIELNTYVKSFFGVSLLPEDNKTENKLERNPEEVDL